MQKYAHTFENEMNDPGFLQKNTDQKRAHAAQKALRAWYLQHARALPWREVPSLYGTWLSEIMLQQTRVETGIPKWYAFRERFPDVHTLALASEEEVMKSWEGLGYYRRARLLHKAAKAIHEAGAFPDSHAGWLALPGIGPYTAAAIASIGLGEAVAAVDGNVQRVLSRWAGIEDAVDAKPGAARIQAVADAWLDTHHPGDHNQAVMELGAIVCAPRNPSCETCPLSDTCHAAGDPALWGRLPVKTPKKKPQAWDLTWHVVTHGDRVAVVQRPETGVWATMWCFPETPPPATFAEVGNLGDPVTHILTHKRITATFTLWQAPDRDALEAFAHKHSGELVTWSEFEARARPRLLTKVWDVLLRAHAGGEVE